MVFVDFSNPYLRNYMRKYQHIHAEIMARTIIDLDNWALEMARAEHACAIREQRSPRPLAAVIDIDEVLLSNIHMNSFQCGAGVQGPEAVDFHAADYFRAPDGTPWPRNARLNPALPGAHTLFDKLDSLGIAIFLVTGRLESIRDETVENLEYVGLALRELDAPLRVADICLRPDDWKTLESRLIMCPDGEYPPLGESIRPYKESRRRAIDKKFRIVLNIGDQVSDLGCYGDAQIHCYHPFYYYK